MKGIDDEDEEELDDFEEDMDADPVKRDDVKFERNEFIYDLHKKVPPSLNLCMIYTKYN